MEEQNRRWSYQAAEWSRRVGKKSGSQTFCLLLLILPPRNKTQNVSNENYETIKKNSNRYKLNNQIRNETLFPLCNWKQLIKI